MVGRGSISTYGCCSSGRMSLVCSLKCSGVEYIANSAGSRGWGGISQNTWCRSTVVADYVLQSATTHSSTIAALLPQVVVWWASSDLPFFTPASAPVLPTWRIDRYESSVAARSKSVVATSTTAVTAPSHNGSTSQSESQGPNTGHSGAGLSSGAKAGIAVGIVFGGLVVLALGFLLFRRRRQQTSRIQPQPLRRAESKRPYLDSKSELPVSGILKPAAVGAAELETRSRQELGPRSPQEFHANSEPQELEASRQSYPVIPS